MSREFDIQEGMQVYSGDQLIGRVERLHGDGFHVAGQHYSRALVGRVDHNRIYLADGAVGVAGQGAGGRDVGAVQDDEIRVPVVEERLAVGTREVELGEVAVRKTVETEEQTVPVTLTRDEVHIEEREVAERPATGDDLFEETTIRVRLRGEEAVVAKEAVVTGEVVIEKDTTAEERQISDTVRRLRVEVEENYQRDRAGLERDFAARQGATGGTRTFADAEQHHRAGYTAAHDERYTGQEFDEAEPALRREYESSGIRKGSGDNWEELREDIRAGWNRARNRS